MSPAAEFNAPALLVGRGERHRSCLWREVPYRRQVWLRSLRPGDSVHVLDDYGNVFFTTVRAVARRWPGTLSKEPQMWLFGHSYSYSACRIFRPGTVPAFEVTP